VVLLLALGLYTCRGRPTGRALFAGAFLLLYGVVIYGLAQNVGYVTRRHVLPPLIPLLGYAAAGVPVLGAALLRAVPGRSLSPRLRARAAVWVSVLLVSGYCLPKALAWHRVGDLATRRAAEWLAGRPELGGPVASEKRRVAYYAGEKSVILDEGGDADGAKVDIATLYRRGARFLIIDEDQIESYPSLRRSLEAAPPALHRTEAGGRRAVVFELRAPKKGQGAGLR
jgi:hypothetical protein